MKTFRVYSGQRRSKPVTLEKIREWVADGTVDLADTVKQEGTTFRMPVSALLAERRLPVRNRRRKPPAEERPVARPTTMEPEYAEEIPDTPRPPARRKRPPAARKCPFCFESIQPQAKKCRHCGELLDPTLIHAAVNANGRGSSPDRVTAALLAFFLGGLGMHKFYLGRTAQGLIYLFVNLSLFWTIIVPLTIGLICFVETVIYLTYTDERFAARYGR